jgi:hypothetical protein
MYNKTDVLGLQTFLRDKFPVWASNGNSVEEIWNNYKNIVYESIERIVPHKIHRKNSDPECCKEIKGLKAKVRKEYNRRKLGSHHREKLKQSLQAATCSQEIGTRGLLKISIKQRG